MQSRIRSVVRNTLPPSAMSTARDAREWLRLARVPEEHFDCANLRKVDSIDLAAAMTDPAAEKDWPEAHEAITQTFPAMDKAGGVNPGDRRAIYYLVRHLRPARMLEVGTHVGASTIHIGMALRANGTGSLDTVDIVDVNAPDGPWMGAGLSRSPAKMLAALGCDDRVTFHRSASLDWLKGCREQFDLIFLDGDHSAPTVYKEVASALPLLAPNGLLLLHDYYPDNGPLYPGRPALSGPWRGTARVRREGAPIAIRPLGDLPWPTKLGVNSTSLALLGHR